MMFPVKPSHEWLCTKAKVSPSYTELVIYEMSATGNMVNPQLETVLKESERNQSMFDNQRGDLFVITSLGDSGTAKC
jgi:hypothetical protein